MRQAMESPSSKNQVKNEELAFDPRGKAIDLDAVATDLPSDYSAIAGKIRRFRDAHSAHTDISHALDMLQSVRSAVDLADQGVEWARNAVPALICSAVIAYVRATKSRSDHRSTLSMQDKLTPQQLDFHQRLCGLRNDAFAHYGPGDLGNGQVWHEERVMIPLDNPAGLQLVAASRRILFPPSFVNDAVDLCYRVMILAQREIERRERHLIEELDRLMDDDTFLTIVKRHRVPMTSIFPGEHSTILEPTDRKGIHRIDWSPLPLTPPSAGNAATGPTAPDPR